MDEDASENFHRSSLAVHEGADRRRLSKRIDAMNAKR